MTNTLSRLVSAVGIDPESPVVLTDTEFGTYIWMCVHVAGADGETSHEEIGRIIRSAASTAWASPRTPDEIAAAVTTASATYAMNAKAGRTMTMERIRRVTMPDRALLMLCAACDVAICGAGVSNAELLAVVEIAEALRILPGDAWTALVAEMAALGVAFEVPPDSG